MDERKTILLIDDDADMREIGRKVILGANYSFLEAASGAEGLRSILDSKPDLVLLDYLMPELSGAEVFRILVTDPRYAERAETPVIMLTAKSEDAGSRKELFEMGLSAFLVKPFGHRELINVIDNVFLLQEVKQKNKELEQRIRRTEYKYQDLIENANDLIFTLDLKGEFVFVNRRLRTLTGYDKEEWIGRGLVELVTPDDREEAKAAIQETLQGKARIFEAKIDCPDGRLIHISTNLTPIIEKGTVIGVVGIARDITQRKKLEQEIVELKNFNESIIQSMGSGLITVDLNGKITSFNSGAEDVLGYSAVEAVGCHLDEILLPEESHRLLPETDSENPSPLNREMELTIRGGKRVPIGFTVTPRLDNRGQKVGTIISFRDISQIKQMQAELFRMDRLAALGVLASGLAHEIRNPLAGIKTMAQTLEEEMNASDYRREYVARIIRQVNRLDELLKSFFSYARPRAPVRKHYQVSEIIREVTALLDKRLKKSNVYLVERYNEGLLPIFVDFHQIQQVFLNLILNALDAMPNGGQLTIESQMVTTTLRAVDRRKGYPKRTEPSTFVEARISDTGVGIPSEHLEAIFDPFFTTKPQGSGLGLSIAYRIIEEHGGEIRVQSEVSKGSTFTVLLPTKE